ncbi:peroxidase-like [Schistocerca piceifrons]|uniref:peroxidase-like n=1 Tax=Schistocerca piceifrons TaxID=274613 RepID=UPI001F5F1378|nr:peroxidase-like [Schistocerca piceifrons]
MLRFRCVVEAVAVAALAAVEPSGPAGVGGRSQPAAGGGPEGDQTWPAMLVNLRVLLAIGALAGVQPQPQQPSSPFFRTSLFPEQLQQQQLQLRQRQLQDQLQGVQQQLQTASNPALQSALFIQQEQLLSMLQATQREQQELQVRLQAQLSGAPPVQQQQEQQQQQLLPLPLPLPPPVPIELPDQLQQIQPIAPPVQVVQVEIPTQVVVEVQEVGSAPPCSTQSGLAGACRPLVQCITFYAEVPELRRQPCRLQDNELGVCCPLRRESAVAQSGSKGILQAPPPPPVVVPPLTPQQLDAAAASALERVRQRVQFLAALFSGGVVVAPGTPAAWHQEFFQTTNRTLATGQQAQKNVEASVGLIQEFQLTPQQGTFALPKFSVLNTVIADTCPRTARCPERAKYRSADGSCNNVQHDAWGKAGTALQRILPPKYDDGVNAPRSRASSGEPLPSARVVSSQFTPEANRPYDNYTLLVMQWGQFLDHDLTHTPINFGQSGTGITCCENGDIIAPSKRHPDCFPILIPNNDRTFSRFGERCMEFVRSLPAPRPECNFGPREQMNQITGYLDGSNIYGSSDDAQRELREFRGGRLRIQNFRGKAMLPENRDECTDDFDQLACFKAGDSRVNEQIDLAVVHTLWMREHNRVARELAALNPRWSDEALFQEARRVVVAELQHITYNEFLPLVLGNAYMDKFELRPKNKGHSKLYDNNVNGGITNVFATAAFRFGHSLIQSSLEGFSIFGTLKQNLTLHKHQFTPFPLYGDGAFDNFVRGLSTQPCQRMDRFFTKEITDHLFQGDLDFGLDLVALNIQRGRDHGLPPYADWREVCNLEPINTWDDMLKMMDPDAVSTLRQLYSSPREVDLFVGAVAERPLPGALLGPTLVCLVGDQFARLRRGDRFFYEEPDQPSSFTEAQLDSIRKTSLARVLCDNTNDLAQVQPLVFVQASFLNQRVSCTSQSIPRVDLRHWRDEPVPV